LVVIFEMSIHKFLNKISIVAKLRLLGIFSSIVLVLVSADLLWEGLKSTRADHAESVQHTVEVMHSMLVWAHEQEKAGVWTREQAQQQAMQMVNKARYGGNEYFWLQDLKAQVLWHPINQKLNGQDGSGIKDPDGQAIFVMFADVVKKQGGGLVEYKWPMPGHDEPVPKMSYVKGFEPWGWVVGSGIYLNEMYSDFFAGLRWTIGFLLVAFGVSVVLVQGINRSVTKGLDKAVRVAQAISQRDLSQKITVKGSDEISHLLRAMKTMSDDLQSTLVGVRDASDALAQASDQIAVGNLDLSTRTEATASNLEESAASMEELTGSVSHNVDVAQQAAQSAHSASEVAGEAGQSVARVVSTMEGITESSRRIGDIIGVIDSIAFQTNILALNAAVEAARAGEQGRGFAVVAAEVRNLAQRSAQAAQEIKTLIQSSVQQVETGAREVHLAGNTMSRVVASVNEVSALINEISHAASEQRNGITQVNAAVAELDRMTQQNAALVEESSAAASSLRDQAFTLKESVNRFRLA
jgi:methyl-accepting chemotaxis protein